ncbi:MAG: transcriptional regulator [Candidatus Thorarchaeota archaeon]
MSTITLNSFRPRGGDTETISCSLVINELDMPTRREAIAQLLEETDEPLTAQDICSILDIKSRAIVYEDIEHISASVKNKGKRLLIRPASCGKCGFVFSSRKSAKRPSKCPKCRSEWILLPGYLIRDKA